MPSTRRTGSCPGRSDRFRRDIIQAVTLEKLEQAPRWTPAGRLAAAAAPVAARSFEEQLSILKRFVPRHGYRVRDDIPAITGRQAAAYDREFADRIAGRAGRVRAAAERPAYRKLPVESGNPMADWATIASLPSVPMDDDDLVDMVRAWAGDEAHGRPGQGRAPEVGRDDGGCARRPRRHRVRRGPRRLLRGVHHGVPCRTAQAGRRPAGRACDATPATKPSEIPQTPTEIPQTPTEGSGVQAGSAAGTEEPGDDAGLAELRDRLAVLSGRGRRGQRVPRPAVRSRAAAAGRRSADPGRPAFAGGSAARCRTYRRPTRTKRGSATGRQHFTRPTRTGSTRRSAGWPRPRPGRGRRGGSDPEADLVRCLRLLRSPPRSPRPPRKRCVLGDAEVR